MTGKIISGTKFLELYPNTKFYILTNKEERYNGYQCKNWFNESKFSLNLTFGGFRIVEKNNIPYWIDPNTHYIREVKVFNESKIFTGYNMFKADKLYLNKRIELSKCDFWNDIDFCTKAIKVNPPLSKYLGSKISEEIKTQEMYEIEDEYLLYD